MAGSQTVTASTNTLLAGLKRTTQWDTSSLTYRIATSADSARIDAVYQERFGQAPATAHDPFDADDADEDAFIASINQAIAAYSLVSGLSFSTEADVNDADLVLSGGYDELRYSSGRTPIARMDAPGENLKPGETDDYQSFFFTRMDDDRVNRDGETGGASINQFVLLHELGHALGLSHPHNDDRGTTAWAEGGQVSTDNKADNARYTVMSYEVGAIDRLVFNDAATGGYGHTVTPSSLDIAALQEIYGTSTAHTGNTTYTLTNARSAALDVDGSDNDISIGRAFYTIWDTGGTDEIEYSGTRNAYINLNDATLVQTDTPADTELLNQIRRTEAFNRMATEHGDGTTSHVKNELTDAGYHAGGYFSAITEEGAGTQLGGYAIANGVVIENATSGDGNDMLIGNDEDNELVSGAGNDLLVGAGGDDELNAGGGDDELIGGAGDDMLEGGDGTDTAYYSEPCRNYEISNDPTSGTVTIEHVDGSRVDGYDILTGIERAKFADGVIDLTEDDIGCPPLDFIFLVDLSGSFSDDLFSFRAAARDIASDLRAENPDVQFAIASFIDKPESPYGSPGDYLYRADLALTDSVEDFEATLDGLSTGSGGDGPEAQWVGLWNAANGVGLDLREDSSRIIYMATDAPAHSAADYGLDETTIRDFLESSGTEVEGEGTPDFAEDLSAEAESGGETAPAGDSDPDGIEVEPFEVEERDAEDPGYDTGAETEYPTDDALLAEMGAALRDLGATPIIGTTAGYGSAEIYESALADMGSGGVVLETSSDGSDIADAVRAGLAEISGAVTGSGTSGDDELDGTDGSDVLLGLAGNDTIRGFGASDQLDGGSGDDTIEGGDGNDGIDGGTGNDTIDGGDGDDDIRPGAGADIITTGAGNDVIAGPPDSLGQSFESDRITDMTDLDGIVLSTYEPGEEMPELTFTVGTDAEEAEITTLTSDLNGDGFDDFTLIFDGDVTGLGLELFESGGEYTIARQDYDGTAGDDDLTGNRFDNIMAGFGGDDELSGGAGADTVNGGLGNDTLFGDDGDDTINGGDGLDTINGGDGDDTIFGGATEADRRDEIYGGDGNDTIDAGYGNDLIYGMDGDDTIAGGFGADELQGQAGNDTITGSALSDLVFGGDGDDFVNGGFGFDRINGGAGADKFYHLGIRDHGSDWVQDYTSADGDVLLFGQAGASVDDFNVQFTHTASPSGERSGDDDVQEAFVVYRPAGLIVWALVDGGGEESLNIDIGGEVFDLLA